MDRASKLVLTGFMGTGKTSAGRAAATRLGFRFIDTDERIVARAGKPIPAIFGEYGEAYFRALEREVLTEVASTAEPAVVATGGGSLIDELNFSLMAGVGVIICLTARPEVIVARVGESIALRPKLVEPGVPLTRRIEQLLGEREAVYARVPIKIDTSDLSLDEVAQRVLAAWMQAEKGR